MTLRWQSLVAGVFIIAGCSNRQASPEVDSGVDAGVEVDASTIDASVRTDAGRDAGPSPDAGPARDAGPPFDAGRRDAGRGDAGPHDAGRDAGYDAGVDAGWDAGPDYDAGPIIGDTCADAIDMSSVTSFSGSTCGADDTTMHMCNPFPAPDLFFRVDGSLHPYTVTVSTGFNFYLVLPCGPLSASAACYGSTTSRFITEMYFAVEKAGGGCGDFTLTVTL